MSRSRVLFADDHTLLLEAFQKLLEGACEVVGMVSDGRALVAAAIELKPDVVIVDVAMLLLNGIDAARQIKQLLSDIRIVFLTMNEDLDLVAEAFRAGVFGYLLKRSAALELLTAIRDVVQRRSYVMSLLMTGIGESIMRCGASVSTSAQLTARQCEVVQLLAEGCSMKEIVGILNITARTVAFHKYQIMEQLRLKSTAELIQFAVKHHMV